MDFPELQASGALEFLSEYGKNVFNPTGIFYWSGRSKTEAKINATIGSAKGRAKDVFADGDDSKITLCIPSIQESFPGLSTEQIFPYAPEVGVPAFRDAWKKWLLKKAGGEASRIEKHLMTPMIVSGITGALSICTRMFVNPGTPVIVPDKRWENYDNIFFRNVGCEIEEFPQFVGQDFNTEGFIQAIKNVWDKQDTATAILNFPNNPTGYCPPVEAGDAIVKAVQDLVDATPNKRFVLLFDDAYEGYVYDGNATKYSLFYKLSPRKNFLPIKMDGISKELLWYGARVGAVTLMCPDEWFANADREVVLKQLQNKFQAVVRNTVSNSSMPAQSAAGKALANIDQVLSERQKVVDILAERYKIMKEELAKIKSDILQPDPFQGGFFGFINLKEGCGLKAFDVCNHLLSEYKIGTVPIEQGKINGIRVAFCSVESQDIPELCAGLEKTIADLTK